MHVRDASKDFGRLTGITFAKQFPNPAEPLRGLFVADQVRATRRAVEWRVIAPVPYAPRWLARALDKPYVLGDGEFEGVPVARPRYPVLPRRMLYTTVAPVVAFSSRRAFDAAADAGAQFVHAHALYPSAAAARRLAVRQALPLIITVHGSDLYSNLVRPGWATELRAALDAASAVVCVSPALARDVIGLAGADPDTVCVIPDTYDDQRFAHVARRRVASEPLRFVSVGRLVPVKGHDVLVRAFASAVHGGLSARLEIVGGGPERATLEGLAAAQGVSELVSFRGPLGGSALADAVNAADVFVLPSRREGLGVALIEALATGSPAVATRSGGPEDIVGPGDGLLVAPDDVEALATGLQRISDTLDRFDTAAISARMAQRYGSESVGRRLVEVYRSVLVTGRIPEEIRYAG